MKTFGRVCLAGVSLLSLSATALAQDVPESGLGEEGEIIVQARRRSETLQNVPQTVNVVTSEVIEKLRINTAADVASVVPGISIEGSSAGSGSFGATFLQRRLVGVLAGLPVQQHALRALQEPTQIQRQPQLDSGFVQGGGGGSPCRRTEGLRPHRGDVLPKRHPAGMPLLAPQLSLLRGQRGSFVRRGALGSFAHHGQPGERESLGSLARRGGLAWSCRHLPFSLAGQEQQCPEMRNRRAAALEQP